MAIEVTMPSGRIFRIKTSDDIIAASLKNERAIPYQKVAEADRLAPAAVEIANETLSMIRAANAAVIALRRSQAETKEAAAAKAATEKEGKK